MKDPLIPGIYHLTTINVNCRQLHDFSFAQLWGGAQASA